EEETHPRADRAQAARGGRRVSRGHLGPRGRQKTQHQRGDLPPLEEPVRWHESRCHQAPEGAGVRERPLEEDSGRPGCGHQHPQGGEPGKLL
ncbi:MAG: Mobile element protein, partial [uncultured Chloroflexia bacterium]